MKLFRWMRRSQTSPVPAPATAPAFVPPPPYVMNIGGEVLRREPMQGPQGTPGTATWWRVLDIIVTWRPDLDREAQLDIVLVLVAPDGRKCVDVYYHVLDARSAAEVERMHPPGGCD